MPQLNRDNISLAKMMNGVSTQGADVNEKEPKIARTTLNKTDVEHYSKSPAK